jgi:hypothetical protein
MDAASSSEMSVNISTRLHGGTSHKTAIFIIMCVHITKFMMTDRQTIWYFIWMLHHENTLVHLLHVDNLD